MRSRPCCCNKRKRKNENQRSFAFTRRLREARRIFCYYGIWDDIKGSGKKSILHIRYPHLRFSFLLYVCYRSSFLFGSIGIGTRRVAILLVYREGVFLSGLERYRNQLYSLYPPRGFVMALAFIWGHPFFLDL